MIDRAPGRGRYLDDLGLLVPAALCAGTFLLLFAETLRSLAIDWWTLPDAGHGLLLAPLAIWLAWRDGLDPASRPAHWSGLAILCGAVLLRYVGGLAAEFFSMRLSVIMTVGGLVVFYRGWRQVVKWWLPFALLLFSIPLPAVLINAIALPLQFRASKLGAAMLAWRAVPVLVDGNVIRIPGQQLFVTEACSGLRSLTALLALGVLAGGLWLRTPLSRLGLFAMAIPVAIGVNGVRVFLTGFLVYFVDPALGAGFMHLSEGWLMFLVAFGLLALLAWGLGVVEDKVRPRVASA